MLGRAVAIGHVRGAAAGIRQTDRLRGVLDDRYRWHAVRAYLSELGGDLPAAATAYAEAGRRATDIAERDHLVRQAARARAATLRKGIDPAASWPVVGTGDGQTEAAISSRPRLRAARTRPRP